jgi:hypothetical protein
LARRRAKAGAASNQWTPPGWYEATPLFTLVGCFLVVAMTEDINIGHRHVLPIYPPLEVLAGAVVLAGGRWVAWMRSALAGLLAWFAADSVAQRSNYLAYFGPQAGGPEEGYRHLVDSSLDWGMNLPALKRWIDTHNPHGRELVFLAYFGTDNPRYYGIRAKRLPGFFERRTFEPYLLRPGYYAISATLFQSVYTTAFGPWNRDYEELYRGMIRRFEVFQQKVPEPARWLEYVRRSNDLTLLNQYELLDHLRFARLCAWLRQQGPPPHQVENAIFIWRLNEADLQAALLGPPVELADFDGIIRPHRHFIPLGQ